ncbi:MAG: helix-turn-helix domain-containing protein, partial [Candidatus Competibacteraceae bacterium]|nr:helix-turn-helix domain-containing protein [Candidatus Competibacteraceae bacterium]
MSQTLQVDIQESAEELKRLMNEQQRARLRERLQVLYWIKVGLCQSLQEIADHLGRSKSIVFKWLQTYRLQGLAGLLKWNFHQCGRRSSLSVD